MREMAKEQLDSASEAIPALEEEIKLLLIPADPEDSKNAPAATKRPYSQATCARCTSNIAKARVGTWP